MTPWEKRGKGQAGKGKGNAAAQPSPHVLAIQRVVADLQRAQAAQVRKDRQDKREGIPATPLRCPHDPAPFPR